MPEALDRERLRGLLAKATPGPWEYDGQPDGHYPDSPYELIRVRRVNIDVDDEGRPHDYGATICEMDEDERPVGNAALIVAAVNALPALLDQLDLADRRAGEAYRRGVEDSAQVAESWRDPVCATSHENRCFRHIGDAIRSLASPQDTPSRESGNG